MRHRRRFLPHLAAAMVAALAAGCSSSAPPRPLSASPAVTPRKVAAATEPRLSTHSSTPTSTPAPPSHPSAPRLAPLPIPSSMLGRGRVGTRADIPWSDVGPGWTVAVLAPIGTPGLNTPALQTVFLVDPEGDRYKIVTTSGYPLKLADISGDFRRALFTQFVEPDSEKVEQLDLSSGVLTTIVKGWAGSWVEYTKPLGKAVVIAGDDVNSETLKRLALTGSTQKIYDTGVFGNNVQATLPLYEPDGVSFVLATSTGFAVMINDGTLVRRVPFPPQHTCSSTGRWWAPDVLLAYCRPVVQPTSNGSSAVPTIATVWRVPIDGGTPSPFNVDVDELSAHIGIGDAWQTDGGVFVEEVFGCGSGIALQRLDSDGSPHRVIYSMPGFGALPIHVVGGTRTDLYLRGNISCQSADGSAVVKFNARTGAMLMLIGPQLGGGTVIDARTISQQP